MRQSAAIRAGGEVGGQHPVPAGRHLAQFGAHEIPRAEYKRRLAEAVATEATWLSAPDPVALEAEIRALRAGTPDRAA